MNSQGFRSQSFDAETRARLRLVTGSPGIIRAKQDAELRRRVEDWRVERTRPDWTAIGTVALLVVSLGIFWASAVYALWYGVR